MMKSLSLPLAQPLALGLLASCLAFVLSVMPRRRAWVVAACLLAPLYVGALLTVVLAGFYQAGVRQSGRHRHGEDILLLADLASPVLCSNASLWLFSIAAVWILIADRRR